VNGLQYNASDQIMQMVWGSVSSGAGISERRSYNAMNQIVSINTSWFDGGMKSFGESYVYSTNTNNGQITQVVEATGEMVNYQYDQLKRQPEPTSLQCSIGLFERPVAHTAGLAYHTYLEVNETLSNGQTINEQVLEAGPTNPHNFLTNPTAPWGQLTSKYEPVPPPGIPIAPNTYFLGKTNPYTDKKIGSLTSGPGAGGTCSCINRLLRAISDYNRTVGVPYALTPSGVTRNSNSFTYTLLSDIGLGSIFTPFVGNAPRWGLLVNGLN
jgi:hypothetical protein